MVSLFRAWREIADLNKTRGGTKYEIASSLAGLASAYIADGKFDQARSLLTEADGLWGGPEASCDSL